MDVGRIAWALLAAGWGWGPPSVFPPLAPPEVVADASVADGPGEEATTADGATPDASRVDQAVRFVAMGDTGEGNVAQRRVAIAILDKCRADGCDFVVLLGDNIYDAGPDGLDDPQWWEKFERPYLNIELPFYAVLGNHDYGGG